MAICGGDEKGAGGDTLKRCPKCGEILMDSTTVCPVCGYEFENLDMAKRLELEKNGLKVPLKNGEFLEFYEELFVDMYPPFLEGVVPAIELHIKNSTSGTVILNVSASIESYAQEEKKSISLSPGENYRYQYYPVFDRKKMKDLKSYGKDVLRYRVDGDLKYPVEKKESITILSYGDILWKIDGISLAPYIVKWITPRDEVIKESLLNRVMDEMEKIKEFREFVKEYGLRDKGMIVGMQMGKAGIYIQTWALYNALKKMGIRYKSTPVSVLEGYQRVRLPREVLKEKGGNCIDLAVTFASALEAMNLLPVIFLMRSHAFPGVLVPKEFVDEYLESKREISVMNRIGRRYSSILGKYMGKKKKSRDVLSTFDEYLYSCCGGYILPIESTLIPNSEFVDAVKDIYVQHKIDKVEEVIVVSAVREEMGERVLPYEGLRITIKGG